MIVPGVQIGPARLGMTAQQLDTVMRPIVSGERAGCPVDAKFHQGRVRQLTTTWGGACMTQEGIQVGIPVGWALQAYGPPDTQRFLRAHHYANGAVWHEWWFAFRRGIAMRTVLPRDGPVGAGVIIALAVFPPGAQDTVR
jgi:hypothetical protein